MSEQSTGPSRPLVGKVAGSLLTQVMVSLANLSVGLVVARFGTKTDYGLYTVLLSFVGVVGSAQAALATTPVTVLFRSRTEADRRSLFTSVGALQVVLVLALLLCSPLLPSLMAGVLHQRMPMLAAFSLSLCTAAYLSREYARSLHYARLRVSSVAVMDGVFCGVSLVSLSGLVLAGAVGGSSAFVALLAAYASSAIVGYATLGIRPMWSLGAAKKDLREVLSYSKWALLGVAASIIQTRAHVFIISSRLGLADLADLSAARLLLMPVGLLITSSKQITLAKGADYLGGSGHAHFGRFVRNMVLFLAACLLCYAAVLGVFYRYVVLILGSQYAGIGPYVTVWGLQFLVVGVGAPLRYALVAYRDFRMLTVFELVAAGATVTLTLLLIRPIGAAGSIWSQIAGEAIVLGCALVRYRHLAVTRTGARRDAGPVS